VTWVKLDDNALDDPTFVGLERGVRLLHLEALAWSNRHAAGGRVPAQAALRFTDELGLDTAIDALADAGLWEADGDGYRLVWLLDDQPTPEEIEATRTRNRNKQRRHRNHLRGDHAGCDPKWCKAAARNPVTNPVTNPGSNDSPTRPDPTLPVGEGEGTRGDDFGPPGPIVALQRSRACVRCQRDFLGLGYGSGGVALCSSRCLDAWLATDPPALIEDDSADVGERYLRSVEGGPA